MSKNIARNLLEIQAVFLQPNKPFTWASGIKSPIYCDNRLTLSTTAIRSEIEQEMADLILVKYPDVDCIVGTATAGIAHAAIVAHLLDKPMAYVRSSAKAHGRQNMIEGKIPSKSKVVVIEDLISTGMSSLDCVAALKSQDIEVLGVVAIFTYGMQKSIDNFNNNSIQLSTLTNLDQLLEVAFEDNYVSEEEVKRIKQFRDNPSDESWITT